MSATLTSYDEVAYPGFPLRQTHPDLLATIAALHGLNSAPPSRCRVLELGGGDGANLIPLAYGYPGSTFLGIDLAPTPVQRGQQCIADLGLTNIELRCGDVMDLTDLGEFDYIIAHGLYSWVPGPVRDRILALSRGHLAPHGVAYISYNAFPGSHVRQMVRRMMRWHVRDVTSPRERIDGARALLSFLAESHTRETAYGELLRTEAQQVGLKQAEQKLYHDDLADVNDAFYFVEFMADAERFGLQFLSEADYGESADAHLTPAVRAQLDALSGDDLILREQYLDFIKCRRFRQTLLCHRDAAVCRPPSAESVMRLAVSCPLRAEGDLNLAPKVAVRFCVPGKGVGLAIDLPPAKAALAHLGTIYPRAVVFGELLTSACQRLGRAPQAGDADALADVLLSAFTFGLAQLYREPPRFAVAAGERPKVSALARQQLRAGADMLTNLRHAPVQVDNPITRQLLLLLDGTRDRAQLVNELTDWVVTHSPTGQGAPPATEVRAQLEGKLEAGLAEAAGLTLLEDVPAAPVY
jgi:methyltransferase-like protein/trans-aconitate methyltransferase